MEYRILQGDCIEQLRTMEANSVHTCVTSPPYYGLRDYGHDGQIGLEETPDAYVAKLVEVFREVRRVLRDDGTLWLNLGDSYASNNSGNTHGGSSSTLKSDGSKESSRRLTVQRSANAMADQFPSFRITSDVLPKNLLGIPWRVAFALQADGWYLRQDIIWHKPNPMPESVTDRCTKAHEYIFLLSKSARYYYDAESVKEPLAYLPHPPGNKKLDASRNDHNQMDKVWGKDGMRNRRSVWTVSSQPYSGAHFATFPPDLIRPCIQAGCPKECCAKCGAPLERVVEKEVITRKRKNSIHEYRAINGQPDQTKSGANVITTGFRLTCSCNAGTVPCLVLDPFGGSGTTAQVAIQEGRNAVIIELNPKYVELAQKRISGTQMPLI
jgi:site-specific DNA-methyltransferase (adenine-specific)